MEQCEGGSEASETEQAEGTQEAGGRQDHLRSGLRTVWEGGVRVGPAQQAARPSEESCSKANLPPFSRGTLNKPCSHGPQFPPLESGATCSPAQSRARPQTALGWSGEPPRAVVQEENGVSSARSEQAHHTYSRVNETRTHPHAVRTEPPEDPWSGVRWPKWGVCQSCEQLSSDQA